MAAVLLSAVVAVVGWLTLGLTHGGSSATATSTALVQAEEGQPAERLRVKVLRELPHDPEAYTQGLALQGDVFVESTGRYGESTIRRWRVGQSASEIRELPSYLFGEGIELVGERLLQLTWKAGVVLIWQSDTLEPLGRMSYEGEGWGLCHDGRQLVMSDGSDVLQLRDPTSFAPIGKLQVELDGRPLANLNELECAEGWIYANVYGSDRIVRIDPTSGRVEALIDASGLLTRRERRAAEVLNGIAYDPRAETFFLTGKLWPKIFEVVFERID
jgi:glutaminyl-peptide cyclotransferase